jgi:general L-amino acid transport system substrate-binding protein
VPRSLEQDWTVARSGFTAGLLAAAVAASLVWGLCTLARAGGVLDAARASEKVSCGVTVEATDWNKEDLHGSLAALGGEVCKAIAVALFGDATKAHIQPYPVEQEGLEALKKGSADVIVGVTPSASSLALYGVAFGPPILFDAQGFMVHKASGIGSLADLAGRKICFIDGTENGPILFAAMKARGIGFIPFPFQEEGEMDAGLVVGRCDAVTADLSKLAQVRAEFHGMVKDFAILPEMLTLAPVTPAYRQGDAQWGAIIDWTVHALVQAEASGVTQANVAAMRQNDDPVVQHLLGADWSAGQALGLDREWASHVIAAVGNYAEVYARTVGEGSPLGLPRGLNALWTNGGLMRPLPVR